MLPPAHQPVNSVREQRTTIPRSMKTECFRDWTDLAEKKWDSLANRNPPNSILHLVPESEVMPTVANIKRDAVTGCTTLESNYVEHCSG